MMNKTKLRQMCELGDNILCGDVRGVALDFHGLGCTLLGEYNTRINWKPKSLRTACDFP